METITEINKAAGKATMYWNKAPSEAAMKYENLLTRVSQR